jgi:hypothetical protein
MQALEQLALSASELVQHHHEVPDDPGEIQIRRLLRHV